METKHKTRITTTTDTHPEHNIPTHPHHLYGRLDRVFQGGAAVLLGRVPEALQAFAEQGELAPRLLDGRFAAFLLSISTFLMFQLMFMFRVHVSWSCSMFMLHVHVPY